jgi:hypothetical protein
MPPTNSRPAVYRTPTRTHERTEAEPCKWIEAACTVTTERKGISESSRTFIPLDEMSRHSPFRESGRPDGSAQTRLTLVCCSVRSFLLKSPILTHLSTFLHLILSRKAAYCNSTKRKVKYWYYAKLKSSWLSYSLNPPQDLASHDN